MKVTDEQIAAILTEVEDDDRSEGVGRLLIQRRTLLQAIDERDATIGELKETGQRIDDRLIAAEKDIADLRAQWLARSPGNDSQLVADADLIESELCERGLQGAAQLVARILRALRDSQAEIRKPVAVEVNATVELPISLEQWIAERIRNSLDLADSKVGEDRAGWIEDAIYYAAMLGKLATYQNSAPVESERERELRAAIERIDTYPEPGGTGAGLIPCDTIQEYIVAYKAAILDALDDVYGAALALPQQKETLRQSVDRIRAELKSLGFDGSQIDINQDSGNG